MAQPSILELRISSRNANHRGLALVVMLMTNGQGQTNGTLNDYHVERKLYACAIFEQFWRSMVEVPSPVAICRLQLVNGHYG